MKVVGFDELYEYDYNFLNIFSMRQHWKNNTVVNMKLPRPTSALLYINDCNAQYETSYGDKFNVKKGDIVYIPKGSIYKTIFFDTDKEKTSCLLIEMNMNDILGEEIIIFEKITVIQSKQAGFLDYFSEMVDTFLSPTTSPALLKSLLYTITSNLSYSQRIKNINSKEFSSIADGIIYMENDVSQEKSIEEIAKMCHVSSSYFRRIFKKYSGISPIQYQLNVKIKHAKKLLQGASLSVEEIAYNVGFKDFGYFSKTFKKQTGISPSKYSKKFL